MSTNAQPPPPSPRRSGSGDHRFCAQEAVVDSRRDELQRQRRQRAANPVKSRHKRQAKDLEDSIVALAAINGGRDVGFLTITSRRPLPWKDEMAKLRRINRLLKVVFPLGWVRFCEFTRRGVLHHHVAGRAAFDLTEGFNRPAYERLRALNALERDLTADEKTERKILGRQLTTNPTLKKLWNQLREGLPKAGFGSRSELVPMQKEAENIAGYLIGGFYYTLRHAPHRPTGCRLYAFSRNFPRVRDTEPTPGQIIWKKQVEAILLALKVTKEQMTARFDTNWQFQLFCGVMDDLIAWMGPDPEQWNQRGTAGIVTKALLPWDSWRRGEFKEQQRTHEQFVLSQMSLPQTGF